MKSKSDILKTIKEFAQEHAGRRPGQRVIRGYGITEYDWQKFWPNWTDALRAAGLEPNSKTVAFDDEFVIRAIISLARSLGRMPSQREMIHRHHTDPSFPSASVVKRIGSRQQRLVKIRRFCQTNEGHTDILGILDKGSAKSLGDAVDVIDVQKSSPMDGYVYLQKMGRVYKIGRSNAPGRREYEVGLRMPEEVKLLHKIRTDDPPGVEAYWHHRFNAKRKNGEWFDLDAADVRAFKRWKCI